MQITLKGAGLLEAAQILAWTAEKKAILRDSVRRGFVRSAPTMAAKVQANVQSGLNVRRKGFLSTYRSRVYADRVDRLPSMAVGSKVRFSGIHEHGGSVQPKGKLLLIPFGHLRVGPKAFRQLIRELMSRGDGYFRRVNGTLILFAENIGENDKTLRRFKRAERQARGVRSLKRGTDVPVAIALPQVDLKKRTDVFGTVTKNLHEIVEAVEGEILRSVARGR